jgi:pilus assembly protein CpaF
MNHRDIHEQMLGTLLAPLDELLCDPRVSESMLNGPNEVYCEREGKLERTACEFESTEAVLAALRNIAQFVGRPFDHAHPLFEGRLPDGSRIQAAMAPVAPNGPIVSIRRFPKTPLTLARLIQSGSLSQAAATWIERAILAKKNLVVSGGTGTGKTSLLNAFSALIPADERVVVIEDSHELHLQREHVVHLEAQPGDVSGRGQVTMRDLFRATLRMRPDRIVVGEIRGPEAFELIAATTSGHGGCMSTLHAAHPEDALARLETMAMMSDVRMPHMALREQIASGIDVIVQVERGRTGARRVTQISQVLGLSDAGSYELESVDLLRYVPERSTP